VRAVVVPEVLVTIVVPSDEVTMVPEVPTPTNAIVPLSALAVLDELLDEEQDMEMKLRRNTETIMSICLIELPFGGFRRIPYITSIGLIYKEVGRFLVGVCFRRGLLFCSR